VKPPSCRAASLFKEMSLPLGILSPDVKKFHMTGIFKQYRTELRNIFILALIVLALPYLPAFAGLAMTAKGLILSAAVMGTFVLAMTLKLYFRILVIRFTKEDI
jgi:hypothetical protein